MSDNLMSIVLPARNNLRYLRWAYASIRKNMDQRHQVCIYDDASNDDTWEWCESKMAEDRYLVCKRNAGPERFGLTILYDKLIKEEAIHDRIFVGHADMYFCHELDKEILKHLRPGVAVCATRIEPPLHPPGPEKIVEMFGIEPEFFREIDLWKFVQKTKKENKGKTTEGIFAPWAIMKEDFDKVGGHDIMFAPQSREDSDLFNRLQLSGMKFIQTWEGFVYHLTSRGSRFNPYLTTVGTDSNEWKETNQRNMNNFIRKWGTQVRHDASMLPIPAKKYDIGFVVRNCNHNMLTQLEPWCSTIYVDKNICHADVYIEESQKDTPYNMSNRVKSIDDQFTNEILVEFDARKINNQNYQYLTQLSDIITDSGEIGKLELGIFMLNIKSLTTTHHLLINANSDYYNYYFGVDKLNENWYNDIKSTHLQIS